MLTSLESVRLCSLCLMDPKASHRSSLVSRMDLLASLEIGQAPHAHTVTLLTALSY